MARRAGWLFWAVVSYSGSGFAQSASKAPDVAPTPEAPAEAAATSAAKRPSSAPDLVVLKDGSRFRGTIAELLKDGPVTIVLLTGETRKLEAASIAFAGPASAEPVQAPAPLPAASAAPRVAEGLPAPRLPRLRLSSNAAYTEFFYGVPNGYLKLCAAPCVVELQPRVYRIGARLSRGDDVLPLGQVLIDQPTEVAANVRNRSGTRGAGGLVLGLSLAELALSGLLIAQSEHTPDYVGIPVISGGFVGSLVGLGLLLVGDSVSMSVRQAP